MRPPDHRVTVEERSAERIGAHAHPPGALPEERTATMPGRDPGPSVKDKELYEKLRDEGSSKEKSARIANAAAATSRSAVGRKGGRSEQYEEWSVDELRKRAAQIGIEGRSHMRKAQLVDALRHH